MPGFPQSARRHYLWSAALVERALREAHATDFANVPNVVALHQVAAARQGEVAVGAMLAEQGIRSARDVTLSPLAFTTARGRTAGMLEQVRTDLEFDRIVSALVSDAGRSAESVATAARPNVGYVRFLSPPSCARCAILAGRVYRYSQGFQRHPGCDCTMAPTTVANPAFVHDPVALMEAGQVTGLSKADRRAIADGADMGRVVNVRRSAAGLRSSGRVLARRGKPTPEAIYARTTTRDEAVQALTAAGYVR